MTGETPLVEVRDLVVAYRQDGGWARAVDGISFAVRPGEVFGLVGESGCGKSTVSLQLLGYRHPSTRVEAGDVLFKGRSLVTMSRPQLDALRGDRIAFVPQNPTTALNPGMRIGDQLLESMVAHGRADRETGAAAMAGSTSATALTPTTSASGPPSASSPASSAAAPSAPGSPSATASATRPSTPSSTPTPPCTA
jgi:peptide/nickel transport system ATP-binding protein